MAGTFTPDQTVVSLSLLANLGSGLIGSVEEIEKALATQINSLLDKFKDDLGPWEVVWGPGIFQSRVPPSVRADNTMFVAKDKADPTRYVIAIAGTNPYSVFDWLLEDVFVARQVPWEFGNPPDDLSPAVADGTHRGLSILQQMQPGPDLPGDSKHLPAFLQSLPAGPLNVTTAGHSLGGALAPVVALWLSDTQKDWRPAGQVTISSLPSAGPTPGNEDFATYYAGSPVGTNTRRLHNTLDVVPHAWAKDDLAQIPTLYRPDVEPDLLVRGLAALAALISVKGEYAQLDADVPLQGMVNRDLIDSDATSFQNFVAQVPFQHVDAYFSLMGIDKLSPELNQVRAAGQTFGSQDAIAALEANLKRRFLMGLRSGNPIV